MSEIRLFIACSLDGFIARENGELDWLHELEQDNEEQKNQELQDGGYSKFLEDIDHIILGRKTYEKILSFDIKWPYDDYQVHVVTSNPNYSLKTANTRLISDLNSSSLATIQQESEKNIWLMGGGQLVAAFLALNAIDQMTLTFISLILGKGIPLFPKGSASIQFSLVKSETFGTKMASLTYRKN